MYTGGQAVRRTRGSSHRVHGSLKPCLLCSLAQLCTMAQAFVCSKEGVPFSILPRDHMG